MGILAQYGTLGIYANKDSRQCMSENGHVLAFFAENYIPSLQFMVSSLSDRATVDLIEVNSNDFTDMDGETSLYDYSLNSTDLTSYYRLYKTGFTLTGSNVVGLGYYYLKITNDSNTYYTDVFKTVDSSLLSTNEYLKITATSANFAMGKNADYVYLMTDFTYLCYLEISSANPVNKDELKEAGEENALIIPNYTALTIVESWTVWANDSIHRFMLGLGMLENNGEVIVTYLGVDYSANENTTEISQVHSGREYYEVLFKMKPKNEMMRAINEIN